MNNATNKSRTEAQSIPSLSVSRLSPSFTDGNTERSATNSLERLSSESLPNVQNHGHTGMDAEVSTQAGTEAIKDSLNQVSASELQLMLASELNLTPEALQARADILEAEANCMMYAPDPSLPPVFAPFDAELFGVGNCFVDDSQRGKLSSKVFTKDYQLHTSINGIDRLMRDLVKGSGDLVTRVVHPARGQAKYTVSKLAKDLVLRLKTCTHEHALYCFPMFQFNPWLTLYFDLSKALSAYIPGIQTMNYKIVSPRIQGDEPDVERFVYALNSFALMARAQARTPEFFNAVRNFKRSEHNNFEGLASLVKRLFDNHSRLLVVRIDLGFKKYCPLVSDAPSPQANDYASAKATFSVFLRAMRAKSGCFEHLLAYAWKAEIGMDRGIHFHTVAFFDGAKVRQDVTYGEWMGQYWAKDVTHGEGHYYNCNRDKSTYRECGVGMVNHDDVEKRKVLHRRVLPYLTKTRSLLKTQFGRQYRSFGRSEIPKAKNCKKGRRRSFALASLESGR